MTTPKHPHLKVLGTPVEGEENAEPFKDLAFCDTYLGPVGFARLSDHRWVWHIETVSRAADDMDTLEPHGLKCSDASSLEQAVSNANRQLLKLVDRAVLEYKRRNGL